MRNEIELLGLRRLMWAACLLVAGLVMSHSATALAQTQTNVTTLNPPGGATNKLPKWNGSLTLTDSAISELNGNVGIGTTSPGSPLEVQKNGIGSTSTEGIAITNTTAAASNAQQWSPRLRLTGQGWKTNATAGSRTVDWALQTVPVQDAANPSAYLDLSSQVNGAGYNSRFSFVDFGYWRLIGFGGTSQTQNPNIYSLESAFLVMNAKYGTPLYLNWDSGAASKTLIQGQGGNVGIGTTSPSANLHVNGTAIISGATATGTLNVTGDINATGVINAKYQDLAEWVPARIAMPAGTVVVLDPEQSNQVMPSARAYDTRVAGVVSANPGVILGEGGEGKLKIATTGRVRVKVDATQSPIRVGDLLVTSNKEGIAMKSLPLDLGGTPIHRPGTLIGKALEPLDKGVGEILVLLSLQ